ncbi:HNH endonuclease signature motif containing protein [Methanorbis rubei]|uniref:HNH nuclease domain-containing protein n=1 Tax=Methanorbis rubei TaxID=3028300 RepID=A0AAE4MFK3_9EURY|nr:hypothetical protein [Methanocorpusculaceae archaeon Cs1]
MTRPTIAIHAGDVIAWMKFATGAWDYNVARGTIMNRRTGRPVAFHQNGDGYLRATVTIRGKVIDILKHRAVWIAAHGILGLPLDYSLEIDHINHDKTDCRIKNLRLVTGKENRNGPHPGKLAPETVREIRRRFAEQAVSYRTLAEEYRISQASVSRLIRGKTYCEARYHD